MTHALHTAFFSDVQAITDYQTKTFDNVRTWPVISTVTGLAETTLNIAWTIASLPIVVALQAASYVPFIPRSIHAHIIELADDSVNLLQRLLSNIARAFTSAIPFVGNHIAHQAQYPGIAHTEGFPRSTAVRLRESLATAEEARRQSDATITDLQRQLEQARTRPSKESFEAAQATIALKKESLADAEEARRQSVATITDLQRQLEQAKTRPDKETFEAAQARIAELSVAFDRMGEARRQGDATIIDLQRQLEAEKTLSKKKISKAAQAKIAELSATLDQREITIADLTKAQAEAKKEIDALQHAHGEDQATSAALSTQIEEIQRSLQAAKERYEELERDTTPVREKAALAERAAKAVEELRGNLQILQTRYDELDVRSKQEIATRQRLLENEQVEHVATKALREQDRAALESAQQVAAEMEQRHAALLAKISVTPEKKTDSPEKSHHRKHHSSSASFNVSTHDQPQVPVERVATPPAEAPLDAAAASEKKEPPAQ